MDKKEGILITGDFYPGNRTEQLIHEKKYSEIFNDFLPVINSSSIAITNLESPLTTTEQTSSKTGPSLRSSPEAMEALKFAGFNLLTLANNHIMDYGPNGLQETIKLCETNKIDYCGAGINLEAASRITIKRIESNKIAIINVAENEFSTTHGEEAGANPLNPVLNHYSIQEARKKADLVIVIMHGGHEFYRLPSPRMKQLYRFFIDSGADAVVGHHTHCYSGYELYNGGYIFYSLGNFIFDHPHYRNKSWNYGLAVRFIIKNKKLGIEIFPYEQSNEKPGILKLSGEREAHFLNEMEELNKIIADDNLLRDEFNNYCRDISRTYNNFLEPFSNKVINTLRRNKIFPSLLSKRKRLLYLNLIRCESHRDVVENIL